MLAARLRAAIPSADGRIAGSPALYLPAALVLALWLVGTHFSGGYFARDWYPAAITLILLLAVTAFAGNRALPEARTVRLALALLAGFVAWNYLSMLWAGSPGSAWEASNELLLYLATAWVLALVPWTGRSAGIFLGAWSVGVAVVCTITLLEAVSATQLGGFLYAFRFQLPIGYPNANAAIGFMAFIPALALSCRRQVPVALLGLLLAAASFLLEFSLLAQSRAAVAAGILILLAFVALMPDRWRLLLRLAVVGVALGFAAPSILDVYSAAKAGHSVGHAIDRAALWIAVTSVLAGVAGAMIGVLERTARLGPTGTRRVRRARAVGAVLAAVAAGVLLVAYGGWLADHASSEWTAITSGKEASNPGNTRFTKTTLYERPDYWRVSLEMFREDPIGGAGAGNFEQQYTIHRHDAKYSRYAHDIWLRALGETGIIGFGLLVAMMLVLFGVPLASLRRLDGDRRVVVVACLAVIGYFILHASFDWLDEIPALAAPAIGLAFIGLALSHRRKQSTSLPRRTHRGTVVAATAVLAAVALVALVPPYLSKRYIDRALSTWGGDPAGAFRDLDRAATLNPLSSAPRMTEGSIAVSLGQAGRAQRAFGQALEVEQVWYPHMELALLDAQAGQFSLARSEITRARQLSRKDPFIQKARQLILARRRIDARAFNRAMEQQIRASFTSNQK